MNAQKKHSSIIKEEIQKSNEIKKCKSAAMDNQPVRKKTNLISYNGTWPPSKRLMRKYGINDFLKLCQKGPNFEDLGKALCKEAVASINQCCVGSECGVASCNHPLCPNCLSRTRFALIRQGCHECFELRLRACLVTGIKHEWETPLGELWRRNPDLIAEEVLGWLQTLDGFHTGPILAIGGVDISLNEISHDEELSAAERKLHHVWAPHFHLALLARDPKALALQLRICLQGIQVPNVKHFRTDKSYNLGRSIAYATALKPERRELSIDERGNATRKSRTLALKPRMEALQWLASAKKRVFTFYKP